MDTTNQAPIFSHSVIHMAFETQQELLETAKQLQEIGPVLGLREIRMSKPDKCQDPERPDWIDVKFLLIGPVNAVYAVIRSLASHADNHDEAEKDITRVIVDAEEDFKKREEGEHNGAQ